MIRFFSVVILASAAFGQTFFQPVVVSNAANPALQGVVAPRSLVLVSLSPPVGRSIPVFDPATTTVRIGGESAQILESAGPGSVIALVPADLHPGGAASFSGYTVDFTYDGEISGFGVIFVVDSAFGLYKGAQNVIQGASQTNNLTHPAHPGDYVSLWGTGLGGATADQVQVFLGGHPAQVVYAGPAPGLLGKDQINFQVPSDAAIPDGCFVAVQVGVQAIANLEMTSNTIAISKGTGSGPCSPPIDLTPDQMASLDAGHSVPFVRFQIDGLVSNPLPRPSLTEAGLLRNESFEAMGFGLDNSNIAVFIQPLVAEDVFYGCGLSAAGPAVVGLIYGGPVNLGPVLTLNGPGTTAHILPQGFGGYYEVSLPTGPPVSSPEFLPPPLFVPGIWSVSSAGVESFTNIFQLNASEPFQDQITLPPTFQVTNFASLQSIDSTQAAAVKWDASGYSSADVVTVTLGTIAPPSLPPVARQAITCRVHATDGQVSIASGLLHFLGASSYLQVSLARRPDQMIRADVPLQAGQAAPGIFSYSFTESFPVEIH